MKYVVKLREGLIRFVKLKNLKSVSKRIYIMFFITKKESETGKKFAEILKKKEVAEKEQIELSEKYGFKTYRAAYFSVWGGFSSCLDFKEAPDKKLWGKGAKPNEYFPKKNSKVGKAIVQEFEDMTYVTTRELNSCIGYTEMTFNKIGFAFGNDEYFGFITSKEWGVKIPNDCEEVTETKYDKLFR